ncbi:MAG: hypothetical protein ACOCYF_02165 [Bacteroidota bacterium]
MAKKKKNKGSFQSVNLIVYIFKRFRLLAAITLVAFIVSVIVSLVITPKYKGTVTFFPATLHPLTVSMLAGGDEGLNTFGEEEDAEKVLQALNSDYILNKINEKYDLYNYYEIDTSAPAHRFYLESHYRGSVSFRRTANMAVEIEVLDKDPEIAASIANDIAAYLDTLLNEVRRERARQALKLVTAKYNDIERKLERVRDSIQRAIDMQVNIYEMQINDYSRQYRDALDAGRQSEARMLETKIDMLKTKVYTHLGKNYIAYDNKLLSDQDMLYYYERRLREVQIESENYVTNKFVLDHATPADKKAYPHRALIVIVSTVSAFLIALIAALVIDNIRMLLRQKEE